MILKKQLVLPFNTPTKQGHTRFYHYSYNWDIIQDRINNGTYIGTYSQFDLDVNFKDVSHEITKLYIEEDGIYCDIRVLSTDKGKLLKNHIKLNMDIIFRFLISFDSKICEFKFNTILALSSDDDYFNMLIYNRKMKIKKLIKC